MLVNELFKQSAPYEQTQADNYNFTIGRIAYQVFFNRHVVETPREFFQTFFYAPKQQEDELSKLYKEHKPLRILEVVFGIDTYRSNKLGSKIKRDINREPTDYDEDTILRLTGTGNAAIVLSTVLKIIKEEIKKYRANVIIAVASKEEPSRISLYKTMAKKLTAKVPIAIDTPTEAILIIPIL